MIVWLLDREYQEVSIAILYCESNIYDKFLAPYDLTGVLQPPVVTSLNSTHCDVTFTIIIQQVN